MWNEAWKVEISTLKTNDSAKFRIPLTSAVVGSSAADWFRTSRKVCHCGWYDCARAPGDEKVRRELSYAAYSRNDWIPSFSVPVGYFITNGLRSKSLIGWYECGWKRSPRDDASAEEVSDIARHPSFTRYLRCKRLCTVVACNIDRNPSIKWSPALCIYQKCKSEDAEMPKNVDEGRRPICAWFGYSLFLSLQGVFKSPLHTSKGSSLHQMGSSRQVRQLQMACDGLVCIPLGRQKRVPA